MAAGVLFLNLAAWAWECRVGDGRGMSRRYVVARTLTLRRDRRAGPIARQHAARTTKRRTDVQPSAFNSQTSISWRISNYQEIGRESNGNDGTSEAYHRCHCRGAKLHQSHRDPTIVATVNDGRILVSFLGYSATKAQKRASTMMGSLCHGDAWNCSHHW